MIVWVLAAMAFESPTCPPADELVGAERWLRSASLDIRGVIPEPEEYQQVVSPDELPDALLEEWLDSDAFVKEAAREHRTRHWNRFGNQLTFGNNAQRMRRTGELWHVQGRNQVYRGSNTACEDTPAVDQDGDGRWDVNGQGQEGYVMMTPYWRDTAIKVCGFDAQDVAVSPSGIECASANGFRDAGCGCGPDLQTCIDGTMQNRLREALGVAMDERVERVIREDRPYTDLFTEDVAYVNGPLVHFYKHLAPVSTNIRFDTQPFDTADLPDLDVDDVDTWVPVPTHESGAGVLTDPAFLLRFMTNRSRVDRFYNNVLCEPLLAPANGIDLDAPNTLDLTQRAGCAYCHAVIEPATVYWGRYAESGGAFLDPDTYPAFDASCYQCSEDGQPCPQSCRSHYIVDPRNDELDPYVGLMRALQFRDPSEFERIDMGPAALVQSQIATGRVSDCLTEKTAQWLLGREVEPEDADVLQEWEASLLSDNWSYRSLVKQIVTSPTYRRVR